MLLVSVITCFGVFTVVLAAGSGSRPGFCPPNPPGGITSCLAKCSDDESCPNPGEKCCSKGCERSCMAPSDVDLNPISPSCPALPAVLPNCLVKDPNHCDNSNPCKAHGEVCCPTQCLGTKCVATSAGEGEGGEEGGDGTISTSDTVLDTVGATASAIITMLTGLIFSMLGIAVSLSLTGLGALNPVVGIASLPVSVIAGFLPTIVSLATTVLPVVLNVAESLLSVAGKK